MSDVQKVTESAERAALAQRFEEGYLFIGAFCSDRELPRLTAALLADGRDTLTYHRGNGQHVLLAKRVQSPRRQA